MIRAQRCFAPHANSASGISRASRARSGVEPFRMVPPFADGRRIDRTPHLNGACGRRRRRALVKSQDLVVPGKPDKADETSARRRLIPDDVLVIDFQQHIRGQRRPPMSRQPAIGQIIFRQFDLIVRERELALKVGLVDGPAGVQRMSLDQYDLGRRQRGVNEAAIEIVLQRLVDETDIFRHAERRHLIDIASGRDLRDRPCLTHRSWRGASRPRTRRFLPPKPSRGGLR